MPLRSIRSSSAAFSVLLKMIRNIHLSVLLAGQQCAEERGWQVYEFESDSEELASKFKV